MYEKWMEWANHFNEYCDNHFLCFYYFHSGYEGKLPEGATKLLALEEFYLSDTFLEFLPANFGRLTKLRVLELRENQLASLPKSMSRLTSLRRLDLGQNDLCDLPDVVGAIPSLVELWLDGNKLDIVPEFIGNLQVHSSLPPFLIQSLRLETPRNRILLIYQILCDSARWAIPSNLLAGQSSRTWY